MTTLMANVFIADTQDTCMIVTTRVVVMATFILSQTLSQTCQSINWSTCFLVKQTRCECRLIMSLMSILLLIRVKDHKRWVSHTQRGYVIKT